MNAGVIVDASAALAWLFEAETWSQRQRQIIEEVPLV
jgi:predicted nucleic acid-binding protein